MTMDDLVLLPEAEALLRQKPELLILNHASNVSGTVQDAEAIGRESARRLVDVIENPKTSIPEKIMVTGRLIEGKSVKQI